MIRGGSVAIPRISMNIRAISRWVWDMMDSIGHVSGISKSEARTNFIKVPSVSKLGGGTAPSSATNHYLSNFSLRN